MKKKSRVAWAALTLCIAFVLSGFAPSPEIKWVDFAVSEWALRACLQAENEVGKADLFSDAVAYLAAKNGNRFRRGTDEKNLKKLVAELKSGKAMDELFPQTDYAAYLRASYAAVLKPIVGDYVEEDTGKKGHGLRCCFPLAAGHWYSHYDDFGSSRSFGFKRKHLGHDIMGSVGTPILATEGGTVTECGWNRYGGWRIGIRSSDNLRYWYYAHLRKDKPFAVGMQVGRRVAPGEVIGYLGVTGYSDRENVNLTSCRPHLHFGLQLIFTPEQEKGAKEIWVDLYALTRFLEAYRVRAPKGEDGEAHAEGRRLWA